MIEPLNATVQEIYCDATSPNIPDKTSFFFKSSYHNICVSGRVHIDFSLHVIKQPVQPIGIWRCRVNFWLKEAVTKVSYDEGFEFYKEGFTRAMTGAEKFVQGKYKLTSTLPELSNEELLEKYKAILAKQNSNNSQKSSGKI